MLNTTSAENFLPTVRFSECKDTQNILTERICCRTFNYLYMRHGKYTKTRPISDGFRKNNVNYWAFREIRSIIPHL